MITVIPRGFTVSDIVTVTASGGLNVTHSMMRIVSDGGAVNVTADPQISPGSIDGEPLEVQGTDDTNSVTFEDGDGLSMSTSITLAANGMLVFRWNSSQSLWIMKTSDTK